MNKKIKIILSLTFLTLFITGIFYKVSGINQNDLKTKINSEKIYFKMPEVVRFNYKTSQEYKHFVKIAQCQFEIPYKINPLNSLPISKNPQKLENIIYKFLDIAIKEKVEIIIFPELSLAMPKDTRQRLLNNLQNISKKENIIIIGGSFYDDDNYSRVPIIGPGWQEVVYKYKPSELESSTIFGKGMKPGKFIPVINTDYGSFIVLTCIDLLSTEAQYVSKKLAMSGEIHFIINNCYNPNSLEFLIEANSLARRHPVFVIVTNVIDSKKIVDNGYSYGHTSLFADLEYKDDKELLEYIPEILCNLDSTGNKLSRRIAYNSLIADMGFNKNGLLIYELNLYLKRIPITTNAPDQGYPIVRNLKTITIN